MNGCPTSNAAYEEDVEYWKLKYESLLSQYIKQEKELHLCKCQNKLYQEMNNEYQGHSVG